MIDMDGVILGILITFVALIVGVWIGFSEWFDRLMKDIGKHLLKGE